MTHLIKIERNEIMLLYEKWYSLRDIAKVLERSPSTISREIKRNAVKGEYLASKAQLKSYQRWRSSKKPMKKIRKDDELEQFIRKKLELLRSPQRIAWAWWKENPKRKVSYVTIYKYIYSRFGYWLWYYLYTERHRPKKRKKNKTKKQLIPYRKRIEERPSVVNELTELWHYECDLIVWKKGTKHVLLTIIDKATRKSMAWILPNKYPSSICGTLKQFIQVNDVKSITFDNGVEFMYHYKLWVPTYFCHPYSSREKPQIERRNRDYRRTIPKWTSLDRVTQEYLDTTTERINNTPMVCLEFDTPNEVFGSFTPSVAFDPLT